MASLITRLRYRGNNSNSPVEDEPPPPMPQETPVPLVAQKIHPNLDVLAAELSPLLSSNTRAITTAHTNPHPHHHHHALTPRRHPSQRSILVTTAERGSTSDSPPPAPAPRSTQEESAHTSISASKSAQSRLTSSLAAQHARPGGVPLSSTKRFVRGLGLAEFGGTEGQVSGSGSPSHIGSSEGPRSDDVVDSPTASTSRGHGGQRDSRSTGTSSSQGNSRPGSGSKHAARPQSAFMTRLALTDAANQPPSPSDAPTHSRSISETTSQYESAVASLRSSVGNVEALHGPEIENRSPESTQISPPRTPGPSCPRHAGTPNTFGFTSPTTSNSASVSARPPLLPFSGRKFAIPRRRSHSAGSGSGSGSRWSSASTPSRPAAKKASTMLRQVGTPWQSELAIILPRDSRMSSPHSTKTRKRRGRSWSRSRSKISQSHRSQSSKRRVSAQLSAHQATVGVGWEADVALALLEMGGRRTLRQAQTRTRGRKLILVPIGGQPCSCFILGENNIHVPADNLSYTQSRAHIYQQRPIDNTGISATTLHSPSKRTDKGRGRSCSQDLRTLSLLTIMIEKETLAVGAAHEQHRARARPARAGVRLVESRHPKVCTAPSGRHIHLPTPAADTRTYPTYARRISGRRSASEPSTPPLQSALKVPGQLSRSNTSGSKGKRKADDVEVTPPKDKEAGRAKFATEPRCECLTSKLLSSNFGVFVLRNETCGQTCLVVSFLCIPGISSGG
ncbi:hypothetical protein IMY05_C4455000500 [Salix suchowensis]|nr:hypothetical protein IMY05_C4455000500 [Salix suchowensis]